MMGNKKMLKLVLLALPLLLAACATDPYTEGHQMLATYGPECQAIGYQPNTDAFRNCVLKLNSDYTRPIYAGPYWP